MNNPPQHTRTGTYTHAQAHTHVACFSRAPLFLVLLGAEPGLCALSLCVFYQELPGGPRPFSTLTLSPLWSVLADGR